MRKLIVMLILMLLLPIGFGISLQADETNPPIEPGTEEEEAGSGLDGDHPWGGEERVIIHNDNTNSKYNRRATFTVDDYLRMFVFVYYGLDFMREPTFKYERPVTVYENSSRTRSTYSDVHKVRSRR